MTATKKKHTVHTYREINNGKYKTTKHYELIDKKNKNFLLSEKINISKDRNFAKSSPVYWLKIREGRKWSKNITGLFDTKEKFIYWGDQDLRKHLIIFKFSYDAKTLTIFYFKNYYTNNLTRILKEIKQ